MPGGGAMPGAEPLQQQMWSCCCNNQHHSPTCSSHVAAAAVDGSACSNSGTALAHGQARVLLAPPPCSIAPALLWLLQHCSSCFPASLAIESRGLRACSGEACMRELEHEQVHGRAPGCPRRPAPSWQGGAAVWSGHMLAHCDVAPCWQLSALCRGMLVGVGQLLQWCGSAWAGSTAAATAATLAWHRQRCLPGCCTASAAALPCSHLGTLYVGPAGGWGAA